jgi:NAD+ diphosphatase
VSDLGPIIGYDGASRAYGVPVVRSYAYSVARKAFDARQLALDRRQSEVVLAIRRPNDCVLLHTKDFYPAGVYRLLSGGIKPGERLAGAVQRELREETGLDGRIERYLAVQKHTFQFEGRTAPFVSHIFAVDAQRGDPAPLDLDESITGFRQVPVADLARVAEQLESLPPDWADWGRFRATAHRLVLELLTAPGEGE